MLNQLSLSLFIFLNCAMANSVALGNPNAPVKGTFQYNLGQQPTTLNALSSSDAYASTVQSYILESLGDKNIDTDTWEPALATSWEIAKDETTFTFTLRQGVKWHDGKPFTAEDVKFSFEAIMDKEDKWKTAHQKSYFENIAEVKILAPNKVQFVAKSKYFKNFDVAAGMAIVPKHLYENTSKENLRVLNKTLVGTGPYILADLQRGKSITLTKNKNWWGLSEDRNKGKNNFEKILMRFIKDPTIEVTRLEKGDIDFIGLNAEQFVKKADGPKWGKDVFKVQTQNKAPNGYGFIGWNLKNPMFESKKVRTALYHLINRDLMIEKFDYNMNVPATGPIYLQSEYADPTVKALAYDPQKALKLLKEDGWKPGPDNILEKKIGKELVKLSFTILEPNQDYVKYLTVFKEDAIKAGVEVKIKYIEWTTFIKLLDERNFEAVRLGWSGGTPDWDPKQIWHTDSYVGGGSNFIGYSNKAVDKLIDEARMTMDKTKRTTLLKKVYKLIADDVPYAFFFNNKYTFYAHTKRMKRLKDTYNFGIGTNYWWIQ